MENRPPKLGERMIKWKIIADKGLGGRNKQQTRTCQREPHTGGCGNSSLFQTKIKFKIIKNEIK